MKKAILKAIPAAILASVCLTTAASAYIDMGDSISYYVSSSSQKWDNKTSTWAWYLNYPADCNFSGTVTSNCKANYTLNQWTFNQSEKEIRKMEDQTADFSSFITARELVEDDYFARVTYVSGGVNTGTVTFKKV